MKVVQFGLRYSPNLGDGIIAECLARFSPAECQNYFQAAGYDPE